ncbi:dynein regulatory complex subunit 6-like isoform X2 [Aphidius gifuensis]|uniref:dynein regulatory complex subunit 6-like isoform X2 n=1 Tax=Aphidius gifuensis TaxID=684658 RepID=UPI001CDB7A77|nr:dynein regulatory complex subunit 6-like isoform X2 [Aphidius gifuensis]
MMSAKRICIEKNKQVSTGSTDYVEEKMDYDVDKIKDFINSLDNDSLAQIFMLLPISDRITMDEVCSKWKEACQLAWYDIKKYKCTNTIVRNHKKCILTQSHVEKILLNCGIYLKELILSEVCDSSIMPVIVEYCKNLTTLEFEIDVNKNDCYTDRSVEAFTQLKQLKVVKIHIHESRDKFQFKILNSLPKDINEIHLFIRPFEQAEAWFMNRIFPCGDSPSLFSLRKFTNLRSLTIRSYNITEIIREISKKTTLVYLDLQKCTTNQANFTFNQLINLEHLNVRDVSFTWSNPNLLSGIFNTCKNLKHLDAPDFHVDLAKIKMENWVNLRNLVYLNIRWQASDAIIKKIIKYCNNLEFINTDTLNSESIIKLTQLENLNYLKFEKTNNINNEVMVAILNNCKKLKHLVIHGDDRVEASIFDDLLKLKYIESLNLACNLNIGPSSITSTAYVALTSLKNLKKLNLEWNSNVEDNFIVKLRGIKSLNCSGCRKLTDAGVIQFIKNNPDLEFLDISYIPKVTIDTIIAAEVAVKNRTNDTFLAIKTRDPVLKEACIKSQWLTCD